MWGRHRAGHGVEESTGLAPGNRIVQCRDRHAFWQLEYMEEKKAEKRKCRDCVPTVCIFLSDTLTCGSRFVSFFRSG